LSLISLENVGVSFGAEDVLESVTGEVNPSDRIGLVGRNGAGKTTLLHAITGELKPNQGRLHIARNTSLALVEQVPAEPDSAGTVYEHALSALAALVEMEATIERAGHELSLGRPGADEEYAALQEAFEARGGYLYRSRLSHILTGLGFAQDDWSQPVAELSGGQRTRLSLARALLAEPDVLILDEPTNHIDIEAMTWLDDFLARWQGAIIVTSHDRYFLDRVANRIWYLEYGQVKSYRGNYTSFEGQRAAELELQQRQAEAQAEFIAKEEAFIRRYRAGQRSREAKGREKRLARVRRLQAPSKQRSTNFKLASSRSGDNVLRTRDLLVGYAEPALVRLGDIEAHRGERIALMGANGSGKTTILKTLNRSLPPLSGEVRFGSNVKVSHYWQEAENLNPDRTVLQEVSWGDRPITPQAARDLLGRFLFSGYDVEKPVSALSGGERSRLALAKLVLEEANLLLLDEPTNHLDIPARESLEAALDDYQGTIVFVSHDRHLIASLADQLWIVEDGALQVFDGTYEEYLAARAQATREAAPPPAPRQQPQRPRKPSQREAEALLELERQIELREQEISDLGDQINDASSAGELDALVAMGKRFDEAQQELEDLMERWSQRIEA
jgi:ATP-binding cassette, subfamily F, member 3